MDNEKRSKEMVKRLGKMEELLTAGERKKIRETQRVRAQEAEAARPKKTYDIGSNNQEMTQRLRRMEELVAEGKVKNSQRAKKDLWAKLSDEAKRKFN
jgi:hypothetical protein